jgi:hypothetical protein
MFLMIQSGCQGALSVFLGNRVSDLSETNVSQRHWTIATTVVSGSLLEPRKLVYISL